MANRIKSAEGAIETPNLDVIKAGGPSSSKLLNKLRDNLVSDASTLDDRTAATTTDLSKANSVFNNQLTSLASRISSIDARIPSVSDRWLVDFFTNDFIHSTNAATINTVYGQATLPILSSQEKLVGKDSRNNVWLPDSTRVEYAEQTTTPNEQDWLLDDNYKLSLDLRTDTAWFKDRGSTGTVWVRIQVPPNLNANKKSNAIIIHPFPVLHYDLASVEYRNPAGTWTSADLTHILGWSSGDSKVVGVGNVRIFIAETQVTELRIKLETTNHWGFAKLSLQQIEFSPTATLVTDFTSFSPGVIGSVVVNGKDQDSLAFLTTAIASDLVSVELTRSLQNTSPIVTGIEAKT